MLIVTAGAMAAVILTVVISLWVTAKPRQAQARQSAKIEELEAKLDEADALLGCYAGVVLVWDNDDPKADQNWGSPKLFGSSAALATLLRYVDASDDDDLATRLLDGLADFEASDAGAGAKEKTKLRHRLIELRSSGDAFSLTITAPGGRFIEADGHPVGARVVLWLSDASIRVAQQSLARGKIEEQRLEIARDPEAFLDMLGKSPLPVWRLSSGPKLEWANPAYLKAVGAASLADAIERDVMFDPETKEQARRALAEGARVDDVRAIIVNGERRHFSIFVFPVSGGATAFAVDITKAVEAREKLEDYARSQEEALNRLDEAVAIFSEDMKLSYFNDAFVALYKLDRGWLAREPSHGELLDHLRERKLIPENKNYPQWRADELNRYADIEEASPPELWRLPDARILRVSRLRHPGGGLLMIFGDITEKIELEARYNTLIRVQKATLDKLSEGVAVFGSDGRLRLSNVAFAKLWKLDPSQLVLGMTFDDLVTLCLPVFADRSEWDDMKARATDPRPGARRVHDGEWKPAGRTLTYVSQPLPDGDTMIAFEDVTDSRVVAEALADKNEALIEADRIKSDFVTHVSYQLRAPMQSIIGYAELLKRALGPDLPAKEGGWLDNVGEAADDLNKLVDDILIIAAIEAGTLELEMSRMEVEPALESAVKLAQSKMDTLVRVKIDCPRDIGWVRADAKRVRQAVYNLILNALAASEAGETVTVGAARAGAAVRIWVEDQGVGIDPADQPTVFEQWKHGRSGGAGLGLALVRDFIEMHGGWVDLESQPGKGTRVTCHIPDAAPDDDEDGDAAEADGSEDGSDDESGDGADKPADGGEKRATSGPTSDSDDRNSSDDDQSASDDRSGDARPA